jgi:hypothetical protein
MSLNQAPVRIVMDSLNASSFVLSGTTIKITTPHGPLPAFDQADVVATSCFKACPSACTLQETEIEVALPESTCECPWQWTLKVETVGCTDRVYQPTDIWGNMRQYAYGEEGVALTVANIISNIVAQVNADPYSPVTAAANGGGTGIILTEKDCSSAQKTCGFEVAVPPGNTVTVNTAHTDAVLGAVEIARLFPILPGMECNDPILPRGAKWCLYKFTVRTSSQLRDPHLHDVAVTTRETTYEIYVDNTLATFAANWDTEILAAISCL